MKLLSWKLVLYFHGHPGNSVSADTVREVAAQMQYEFYCWNGRVRRTHDGTDTGISITEVG